MEENKKAPLPFPRIVSLVVLVLVLASSIYHRRTRTEVLVGLICLFQLAIGEL